MVSTFGGLGGRRGAGAASERRERLLPGPTAREGTDDRLRGGSQRRPSEPIPSSGRGASPRGRVNPAFRPCSSGKWPPRWAHGGATHPNGPRGRRLRANPSLTLGGGARLAAIRRWRGPYSSQILSAWPHNVSGCGEMSVLPSAGLFSADGGGPCVSSRHGQPRAAPGSSPGRGDGVV